MAQYLHLPSGNSFLLKEGEDPQEGWARALQEFPNEFRFGGQKTEPKPEGGFGAAFSAGLSRLGGEAALTAGKAGILDLAQAEEIYRRQQQKAAKIFKPTEEGWTESPWQKFKEVAGGSAAYMLAPAAAGIGAAFAPVSVPLIGAAGLGAGLVSLGQFTGSNLAAQMEEDKKGLGETSGAAAVGAAIPQAALDVLSFRMIPGVQRLFGSVGREVTEAEAKAIAAQTLRQKAGDYITRGMLVPGSVEGMTEVAQDVLEKLQAGANLSDPKAREQYIESLIGGAALGAVLGPVGRFVERGRITTRGQELEQQRVKAEADAKLAAETEFQLTPPEGPMGPEEPAAPRVQRIQAQLSELEYKIATAQQTNDVDALTRFMKVRDTLESQLEALTPPEQTPFERRRGMEQLRAGLESLQIQLQKQLEKATTAEDQRAVLERLADTEKRLEAVENEMTQAEAKGEIPTLTKHANLLAAEKRAVQDLQKAGEAGDTDAQLKAATKLATLQEQLGLFGMDAFAAQEQAAARARAQQGAQDALQASGRTLRLPAPTAPAIPMGFSAPLFGVPSSSLSTQETLFGAPERQFAASTEQAGMPQRQLEQAITTLATKPDLKPEDRALLERVQDVATPAPGLRTDEVIQERLRSLQELRSRLEAELLARGDKALKADEAAAAEEGVAPEEIDKLSDKQKLQILRKIMPFSPLIKRLDRLDQIEAEFNARLAAADRTPLTKLEKLSTTGAVRARARVAEIQKEIDALERGAQTDKALSNKQRQERIAQLKEEQAALRSEVSSLRQRITDWLSDTARGLDNTNSRRALEEALQQLEAATRREGKEALTTTRRRIATPEERRLLGGKKTVVERAPTIETAEVQQPDLFAGTEAATAVEFRTPEQFQKFMGSEELNKLRRQQGLLKPTVAYLQKQAQKIESVLERLKERFDNFKLLMAVRTEDAQRALTKAQKQYAEAWQEVLNALPAQHAQYLRAKEGLANARETYAGLADFQKAAMDALERDLAADSAWAQIDRAEKERFLATLKEPKQKLEAAIEKLAAMREQIAKAQIGEATDPFTALWPEYSLAQKEAQKAYEAFQKVIRDRTKVVPPANAVVASKEIQNFLVQDVELTEMLINQQREVYKFERALTNAKDELKDAKNAVAKDTVMRGYLDAAEDVVLAAQSWLVPTKAAAVTEPLTVPVKLQEAIRKANTQLRNVRQQTAPSPGATAGERYERYTDPARAAVILKELEKLKKEQDVLVKDARQIAFLVTGPENRERQNRIAALEQELASIDRYKLARREQSVAAAEERSAQQTRTSQEIQAENERLAREAEATARVTFKPLSPEKQKALDEAQQQLDTAIKNKQAAIEQKENQTQNFRLAPELKKTVADAKKAQADALAKQKKDTAKAVKDGKKTKDVAKEELQKARENASAAVKKVKDEAVEQQRAADIQRISAMFDEQIKQKQAVVQALRGVSLERPSERREAQARQLQELQRRIGEPVNMTEAMQDELLTDAEKKAIDDGTKTLEQVMKARGRVGRTGQTVVNVRTGRVSEAPRAISSRDLTKAAQEVENAEANRLSAEQAAAAEARYVRDLLAFAKRELGADYSDMANDVIALEYAVLNLQAEQEAQAAVTSKRKATEKEQAKTAKTVAESLSRITSSEYTDRENTPLDATTTAAVNKGNLVAALTSLAENGSTPFVRMVAKRLLPMVENTALETASLEGKGGEFDPNTNTITLNEDALTEEDLLHEAGHAATNAVASYEPKEFGMSRRQFLKGAASGLTAMKLPSIGENLSLDAQERLFFEMLDGWNAFVASANKLMPSLKLDPYINLGVADRDLRGFLTQLEYNEVGDWQVAEMLENGGLKKLQSGINASQRAIMAEATKTGEGKAEARKETFTPTKEQLDARTALEKLYAKMQTRPEFKDEYGNVSFKEFVSELLSNQQVRDKIDQTKGLLRRIYEGFLRMLGIEPTTLSDKAVEQAFAMFSPSQASLNREERLASIMRGVFPGTGTKFSAAVPQSVQDAVNKTIARTATLGDKIVANTTGLRLRTFIADSWAPVEALLKMGVEKGKIKEAQALQMRVYMRQYSNQQQYTNAALSNGVPEIVEEKGTGVSLIEGGDAQANARTIAAALGKASVLGNQQAIERTFTLWMASLRAKQDGVGFEKLNFKNPPTAAELAALDQMFKDNPEVKAAFDEARALYKQYNKRLLNLQVQSGAMSQEVADELGKGDYIGYYRVDNNGVVELVMGGSRPMRIGSVVDQPYLKELVGGEQHILPFFSSMVQNTSMLMTIALKNLQNKGTARMFENLGLGKVHIVPDGQQSPVSKIRFKSKGNEFWFEADKDAFDKTGVPVDLMMQGLQGVKTAVPALVRGLAMPADILRKAIRRLPTYTLKQTIRDPMHAYMVTGGNFMPVLSTWKELYKGMTGTSQTQMTLEQAAVVAKGVYQGDTESVANMLRELSGNPSKFSQTMMKLDELAMRGEAATRAVLYDTFRKKGMSHIEAILNTTETMNFGRRGTSASLHWLSMMTPFFNAQIQGLDSVYRSLKGDNTFEEKMNARNALLKRGALMAGATMMYAMMMEDDEAYKNATPAERYGNWFVRVPGTDATIRVPIPFELGLIFKSMPEAFVNTAFGDTKASEAIKALGKQLYMSTPGGYPTALKGPLEVAFNYDTYSDRPIETDREKAMDPDQRYRAGTTELAKLLGKTGILSPVQIDHLVRSYLSSVGILGISMANMALRPITSREGVEKPEMVLEEVPVIGSLFQPRTGRGMVNAAFEDMHRIERAANTYKTLAASDPQAAQEYANEFARDISMASFAGRFRQQMGEFAKYKRMIAANPDLTPAEKRQQIETIKEQEIRYSTMLRKAAA